MEFSDITKAVHDFWLFIWPPVVMLFIVWITSNFFGKDKTRQFIRKISESIDESKTHVEAIRRALEPYGLSKIIPITSAIIVVFVLYLLNGPITQLASLLPPHLVFTPTEFHKTHSNEREMLLLLRTYPAAASVSEAYSLARKEYNSEIREVEKENDRIQIHYKIQNFLKFAFICSVVLGIMHRSGGAKAAPLIAKFSMYIISLALIWFAAFPFLLFSHEQTLFDEWHTIEIKLQEKVAGLLDENPTEKEQELLKIYKDNTIERDWWEIRIWNKYMVEWINRTIFKANHELQPTATSRSG